MELRPSQAASQLISFTCLAMEPTQGATHLFEKLFIKADSCANPYLFLQLWVERQILNSGNTLCLHQIRNLKILTQEYKVILTTLYSCLRLSQNREKISACIPLNHEN